MSNNNKLLHRPNHTRTTTITGTKKRLLPTHHWVLLFSLIWAIYQISHPYRELIPHSSQDYYNNNNNPVSQQPLPDEEGTVKERQNSGLPIAIAPESSKIERLKLPFYLEEKWSKVKVVVFMTTHLPKKHLKFLPCWYDAIQRMSIYQNADLILYTPKEPDIDILSMLPFRNIIIKLYTNTGYQQGAIQAMRDPFIGTDNSTWFDNYDWVIRVNMDVLIRYDMWLIITMLNPMIDGIFHDCKNKRRMDDRLFWQIHTDFHAFRPSAIIPKAFLGKDFGNAERHASIGFENIYESGRFAFVEGASNPKPGDCRIQGEHSPVLHNDSFFISCPYYYNYTFY